MNDWTVRDVKVRRAMRGAWLIQDGELRDALRVQTDRHAQLRRESAGLQRVCPNQEAAPGVPRRTLWSRLVAALTGGRRPWRKVTRAV